MPIWVWIVIVVVVVLAIGLGIGLVRARRRRISLTDTAPSAPVTEGPPAKGGYRAGGSISFSSGTTATAPPPEHPVQDRPEVDGQPAVGDDAAVPRDSVTRPIVDVILPEEVVEPKPAEPLIVESLPEVEVETAVEVETVPAAPAEERIEPTAGRLGRLRGRLARSQNVFGQSLLGLLGAGTLDEDSWTDVEDTLLMADLGAKASAEITEKLRAEVAAHGVVDAASARAALRKVLIEAVGTDADRSVKALPHDGRPSVVLVVGVNGTGKTTTTGKLARVLVADGRHVVLGAADTFRAAAADQLATWAERAGAVVVRSGRAPIPPPSRSTPSSGGSRTVPTRCSSTPRVGCTRRPA